MYKVFYNINEIFKTKIITAKDDINAKIIFELNNDFTTILNIKKL